MNLPIQKYGKTERRKFGKINEVIDIPDLVEIQKESYRSFIGEGISEILEDFSPITDFSDHFELYFLSHEFGLFLGRAFGLLLFIFLAYCISQDFALKYALIIVGGLQLLAYPLAKNITNQTNRIEYGNKN